MGYKHPCVEKSVRVEDSPELAKSSEVIETSPIVDNDGFWIQ